VWTLPQLVVLRLKMELTTVAVCEESSTDPRRITLRVNDANGVLQCAPECGRRVERSVPEGRIIMKQSTVVPGGKVFCKENANARTGRRRMEDHLSARLFPEPPDSPQPW
jgi:hypothetical protein